MEIVTYVLSGEVEHKDSLGNGSIIKPGEVQRMTAGTGITHSEFNPSKNIPTHFLQIWILPKERGLTPSYEQISYDIKSKYNQWLLIAAEKGGPNAVVVHQDIKLFTSVLNHGKLSYQLGSNRFAWIHVVSGSINIKNVGRFDTGDGIGIKVNPLDIIIQDEGTGESEILLFDLP